MKLKLGVSLLVAILSVPVALAWAGASLPGAQLVGPLIAALAGFYASLVLTRSEQVRSFMGSLESFKPSESFVKDWEAAGTAEKRDWRGRPTGQATERGGFSWIYVAVKTILKHAWATQPKWTLLIVGIFLFLLISSILPIPGLSVLGAALSLYVFTALVFTAINLMTEGPSASQ